MKKPMKLKRISLADRVIALVEDARSKVAAVANAAQVYTNYAIGRMIVEEQQGGSARAGHGETVIPDLSEKLTRRFGRGWSVQTLAYMRQLYLTYSPQIFQSPIGKSVERVENFQSGIGNSPTFTLSWTHYVQLLSIRDPDERCFYERCATEEQWNVRKLSRQISMSLYERIALSNDKRKARTLLTQSAPRIEAVDDALKDESTLEFLGLRGEYDEGTLEQRIFNHIEEFMLEFGKGFTFYGRQVPCVVGAKTYHVDLAFYNRYTRSFFLVDLKLKKVGHDELGQMQMYVHYFDRKVKLDEENPTIGILLSSETIDRALVEMTLPECEHNRIFVKQYKTVLPSKDALKRIVLEEKRKYENERLLALAAAKQKGGRK